MTSVTEAPELNPSDERVFSLQPGELLHYDYRTERGGGAALDDTLRVLVWNIERGSQLDGIIATLRACQADVMILQELDIYCRRSGYRNVPERLSRALQAEMYFVCEFEEYDCVDRPAECAVGPLSAPFRIGANSHVLPLPDPLLPPFFSSASTSHITPVDSQRDAISHGKLPADATLPTRAAHERTFPLRHLHGNAILSRRMTLHEPTVLVHSVNANWPVLGPRIHEPRCGGRAALRVTLAGSQKDDDDDDAARANASVKASTSWSAPPLYLYNCHLEVFCGVLTRVRQLGDCMHDAQQLLQQWQRAHVRSHETRHPNSRHDKLAAHDTGAAASDAAEPAFLIAGDFNTVAHGLARLSRFCGTDRVRVLGLGETEACWLQRKVLSRGMSSCSRGCVSYTQAAESNVHTHESPWWWWLKWVLLLLPRRLWRCYQQLTSSDAMWRLCYGFDATELARLNNTELGFYDPSDKFRSVTLSNPLYHGLVGGKLDWLLLSNMEVRSLQTPLAGRAVVDVAALRARGSVTDAETIGHVPHVGHDDDDDAERPDEREELGAQRDGGYVLFNDYYTDSDHKGIMAVLRRHRGRAMDVYPRDRTLYTRSVYAISYYVLTRILFWAALCYAMYHLFLQGGQRAQ